VRARRSHDIGVNRRMQAVRFVLLLTIGAMAAAPGIASPSRARGEPIADDVFRPLGDGGTIIHVPGDVGDIQTAINLIPEGGIIEIAAGTYASPVGGFLMNDLGKGFTIRAALGATVVLDGGHSRDILRLINSSVGAGGPIVFQDLTFANGRSTTEGAAGGVTVQYARATFVDCVFLDNAGNQPSTGGGGISVALDSTVFFIGSTWQGNSATHFGGGLDVSAQSKVYIHNSAFVNNRTNLPNHDPASAGGAIHVTDSLLRVSNSRFEENQAGYVGGAIYALGTWLDPVYIPRADITVSNSTFVSNKAVPDPSVSLAAPTEGGALHFEDQTGARIYSSRFTMNSAMTGGALNSYRATVEIYESVFKGNQALGQGAGNGFGAAISVHSNDTAADGSINRRSASLTVRDSVIQGRFGAVGSVGQSGGGIAVGGDSNRTYGQNGVSQMGTAADNRAVVDIQNTVFADLDVQEAAGVPGSGVGGALEVGLTGLSLADSLVIHSDAIGDGNGSGGGIAVLDQSYTAISGTAFSGNTAGAYGGAVFVQGSTLEMSGSLLIENEVSPGVTEGEYGSYGAAIFAAPDMGRGLQVNGHVMDNVFSGNVGLAAYDDDRTDGPINDIIYANNQFYATTFGSDVYRDSIPLTPIQTAEGLNSLIVSRANSTTTDKGYGNTTLGSAPDVGILLAEPSRVLPTAAAGDPGPPTESFLAYAWSGTSATLEGTPLLEHGGLSSSSVTGSHTLDVNGNSYHASLVQGDLPSATFSAIPVWVSSGGSADLNWAITAGPYLDVAIDQGVSITPAISGTVVVSPATDVTYRLYGLTEDGGMVAVVRVKVGTPASMIYLPLLTR
jgi:hypothetical protein